MFQARVDGYHREVKLVIALFALGFSAALAVGDDDADVELVLVADGFTAPLTIVEPPDGSDRLFVVDQPGQVWIIESDGNVRAAPFLDISDRILELEASYDERGLLGLAFHPDYANNGRFFVYYSTELAEDAPDNWDHTSHVSEFRTSDDPDVADPDSERVVLRVDQPYHNHNGGTIAMGPDGYLYVPLGDGGNGGDVDADGDDRGRPDAGWAQTTDSLLGSILRIDIDAADGYGIPADNPFVGDAEVADEIFAYGFRNPYGLSFDLETGDVYAVDAGQALFEEVNLIVPGGNYGWNIREGIHCFDPDDFLNPPPECPDTGARGEPLLDPVISYQRGPDRGSVIIPGVFSRDESAPSLTDRFVFGDYSAIRFIPTGILYAATPQDEGLWPIEEVTVRPSALRPGGGMSRFLLGVSQDLSGRLHVLTTEMGGPAGTTGEIYTIDDPATAPEGPWLPIAAAVVAAVLAVSAGVVWAVQTGRFGSGTPP
jgi:glucose/arabinose dehydrogenase